MNIYKRCQKSVDLILSDPPFGVTSLDCDMPIDLINMWQQFNRIIKPHGVIVLFSVQPFTTKLIMTNWDNFKYQLIWKKNVPTGMAQSRYRPMRYHEEILVFNADTKSTYNPIPKERVGKHKECYCYNHYCGESNHIQTDKKLKKYDENWVNPSTILEFNVVPNRSGKVHPLQKPVDLMEYLVKTYSNESDLVLDPFMGSGSTGVACKALNRNFIGIEKNKEYFEVAKRRIEEVGQISNLF